MRIRAFVFAAVLASPAAAQIDVNVDHSGQTDGTRVAPPPKVVGYEAGKRAAEYSGSREAIQAEVEATNDPEAILSLGFNPWVKNIASGALLMPRSKVAKVTPSGVVTVQASPPPKTAYEYWTQSAPNGMDAANFTRFPGGGKGFRVDGLWVFVQSPSADPALDRYGYFEPATADWYWFTPVRKADVEKYRLDGTMRAIDDLSWATSVLLGFALGGIEAEAAEALAETISQTLISADVRAAARVKLSVEPSKSYVDGINKTISAQKQARHVKGTPEWLKPENQGGYFKTAADAQKVLDAVHSGGAKFIGTTERGQKVFRFDAVTGFNNNKGAGFLDQPTHIFMLKGSKSPSLVPFNPAFGQ